MSLTDASPNALSRHRAQTLAALPTAEEAMHILRDLVECGLPDYTEPADEPFTIPNAVAPEFPDALLAWEERHQLRAQLWVDDRFRLGFALGASLLAPLIADGAVHSRQ